MRKLVLILLMIIMSSCVLAADEITQSADRLNYWNAETHTVSVTNNGADSVQVNLTIPSGFTYNSGTCTNPSASIIQCDLTAGQTKNYLVDSSTSQSEYVTSAFTPTTNNSYTGNSVRLIRIQDDELTHTLVEYGRGRGNYFFDSFGSGYAGSGHTGTGCAYLPNSTMFELNFLHKINNVKQYFGNLDADAYNATFDCIYPPNTVVREHLITAIETNTSGVYVSYEIPKIEGSWERMGYLGMDFDVGDYNVGNSITINCTNIQYVFPEAGGSFLVNEDSFTLEIRDREPFIATAYTTEMIGNGTQEVIISYNITNNELYTVDDVIIEIQAPKYATFIGTTGELWGVGLDQYRIEKTQMLPGESEIVRLIARYDTSNAGAIITNELTEGVKVSYVTCWELNAYNPTEYTQTMTGIGSTAVNMSIPTNIISVINRITEIFNIITVVNTTTVNINNTVNNINSIVNIINTTTQNTNSIVIDINNTANSILNKTEIILNNTNIILEDTTFIIDLLNCNGTDDSPICDKIRLLNQSITNIFNLTALINYTAHNLNITVIENINTSGVNISFELDLSNITNRLREIKKFINCTDVAQQGADSVCNRIERIENNTVIINNTVNSLSDITTYFNTTVFGNMTFQQIMNAISNINIDTSSVLKELQELRSFDEEVVFLITDSFGLQQNAREEFADGDVTSAVESLSQANSRLREATERLVAERNSVQGQLQTEEIVSSEPFNTKWLWAIVITILGASLVVYLFGKVPAEKQGKMRLGIFKILPLLVFLLLCVSFASAGTITQYANAVNYEDNTKSMTVIVNSDCTGGRQFNVTVPTGSGFWIDSTSGACSNPTSVQAICNFNGAQTGTYVVSQHIPGAVASHTVHEFTTTLNDTTDCSVSTNVSFIKIPDEEVFYTLVEYGRGRGNYFFSTRGGAGSGGTGVGCNYVPNGTMFELNFLHKIFNIKQYFDDPDAVAANAIFTCSYPNRTIVRSHLGTTITQGASTTISYFIDQIEGSWERMGYVGMQFDPTEQYVGQNLLINCTKIMYALDDVGGNISVYSGGSAFNLEVRDPTPFVVTATTTSTVGNGTQEVIITYNITNAEVYTASEVVIEIDAPPYAEFIGTRGELWGSALDQYRIEKISLAPGESEIVQLVARFDTTNAPAGNTIRLTDGVRIKYVTCWDLNAYNPAESVQQLYNVGNATLNMGINSTVINLRERIERIFELATYVNETTIATETTVNTIESVVNVINSTTFNTNIIVLQINNTVNTALSNLTVALTNTESIIVNTNIIKDLLNCNGTVDTPICADLDSMNNTVNNITSILIDINQTLNNITITVNIDLSQENLSVNITPDLTNLTIIINDIEAELNCSMNWTTEPNASLCQTLRRIENNTIVINNTVNNVNNLVNYFNTTVFGDITLQEIYNAITNITLNTTDLLTEIRRMSEFDQELVFLVTDAFGLQKAAKEEMDNGNLGGATAKLREANSKLNEAAARLNELQTEASAQETVTTTTIATQEKDYSWVMYWMAAIIVVALVAVYLFSKPKDPEVLGEEPEEKEE